MRAAGEQKYPESEGISVRTYQGTDADLSALTQVRNATLRDVMLPGDYRDMSPADLSAYYKRGDFDLNGNCWLLFDGALPLGAAVVYPPSLFTSRYDSNFDLYIVPARSGRGLGTLLLSHLEQLAPERGYRALETTIAGEDERSNSFLINRGFVVVGRSLYLVKQGIEITTRPEIPKGFTLRSLIDDPAPAELYFETANRLGSYDHNYSLVRPEEAEQIVADPAWDPSGVLLLRDESARIAGLIRASVVGEKRGRLNEVRLEPASRGRGLGAAMVRAALSHLAERNVETVELATAGETTPAHQLAIKAGFHVVRHWLHFLKQLPSIPAAG